MVKVFLFLFVFGCLPTLTFANVIVGDIIDTHDDQAYDLSRVCTVTEVTGDHAKVQCSKYDHNIPIANCQFVESIYKTADLDKLAEYPNVYGVNTGDLVWTGGRPVTAQGFAFLLNTATVQWFTSVKDQYGCWRDAAVERVESVNFPSYGPQQNTDVYYWNFDTYPQDPWAPIQKNTVSGYAFRRDMDYTWRSGQSQPSDPIDTPLNQFPVEALTYFSAKGDPINFRYSFWYESDELDNSYEALKGKCALNAKAEVVCVSRVLWNSCLKSTKYPGHPFNCGEAKGLPIDEYGQAMLPASFVYSDSTTAVRAQLGYFIEGSTVKATSTISNEKIAGFLGFTQGHTHVSPLPEGFLDQVDAYVRANGLTQLSMAMTDAHKKFLIFQCDGFDPRGPTANPSVRKLCVVDPETGRLPTEVFAINLDQIIH